MIVDRPSFTQDDVLTPDDVRAALPVMSDRKWDDVKARIPWSDQVGPRKPCIRWGRFLNWLEEAERRTA